MRSSTQLEAAKSSAKFTHMESTRMLQGLFAATLLMALASGVWTFAYFFDAEKPAGFRRIKVPQPHQIVAVRSG